MEKFQKPLTKPVIDLARGDVVLKGRKQYVVTSRREVPDLDAFGGEVWATLRISGRELIEGTYDPKSPLVVVDKAPVGNKGATAKVIGRIERSDKRG